MKITKRQLRKLIRESLEDNSEFFPKLLQMAQLSYAHYLQAKEIASTAGLNIDLEMELLKLIKQEIDQLLVSVTERINDGYMYSYIVEGEGDGYESEDEFSRPANLFDRGIIIGYQGSWNSMDYGAVYLGDDAIIVIGDYYIQGEHKFDNVQELMTYLREKL